MFFVCAAACGSVATSDARRAPTTTMGTPDPQAANEVPADGVECSNEVRTGTHLERKVCRTEEERAFDRRQAQQLLLTPVGYPHRF